jgi:site-specific DNA-methyltransferase (adenine-specific)
VKKVPRNKVLHGNSLDLLRTLPDGSIDSIVTDPPYELGFMGKSWDASGIAYNVELWAECLRVLKPGGHLLAFGGTRTYHRMAVAIEDAGFEIRDSIHWIYGSGFPKSLDVSKAIDKEAGAKRKVVGSKRVSPKGVSGAETRSATAAGAFGGEAKDVPVTAPATEQAKQWDGWGTALKPAHEPIVLARKPLDGTVAANVKEHGTGALNIDGCRIGYADDDTPAAGSRTATFGTQETVSGGDGSGGWEADGRGRWPANVIFDEEAAAELDAQSGIRTPGHWTKTKTTGFGEFGGGSSEYHGPGPKSEAGGASRFFYCAKPSRKERNAGLDGFPKKHTGTYAQDEWSRQNMGNTPDAKREPVANFHPTVKPVALMRYLVRLVTPPNGVVLDPFLGSGTTAVAAILEGFDWLGCEMTEDYLPIIKGRVAWAKKQTAEQQLSLLEDNQ